MTFTFGKAVEVFKSCFTLPKWTPESVKIGKNEVSVPAFPSIHNEWVHYRMWKDEEWHTVVFYVEFVICKDADNRWDLIRRASQLLDGNPGILRYLAHWTYYADNHWGTRLPAWNEATLREDIEFLKTAVAGLSEPTHNFGRPRPPVGIGQTCVRELLKQSFVIPDYQRPYCWETKNVEELLEDLSDWYEIHKVDGKEYHLGSIILKRRSDGKLEVIDGQQRLITLSLLAAKNNPATKPDIILGSNNESRKALDAIANAKTIVQAWGKELDLTQVVVSVVEIGKNESDDLAFNFFNHLNSSGVPLTDYELLKGHHLRYIKEDTVAKIMAARWHSLDTGSVDGLKERLLHKCLFRIRKWLAHEWFAWDADARESHDLFHEFSLEFDMPHGLCTPYRGISIDSMLSGGLEFFDYVNRYRLLFESFIGQESVRTISSLQWRSYGVLHDAVVALAFLFYCKFGDIYLKDAIYAIAWNVSSLRSKMGQVRRNYLGDKHEFRNAAQAISRATHESEAIGKLLDDEHYFIDLEDEGENGVYWRSLKECAEKLEGKRTDLLNVHYTCTYEQAHTENKQ